MQTLHRLYLKLNKVSDSLIKVVQTIVVLIVVLSILTVMLQVVNRYILTKISDISIHFTDELSRYLMIWSAYLSIAMCLRDGSMARVDIVYGRLGEKAKYAMYYLTCIMTFALYFVIIRYGIQYAYVMRNFKTSMLKWPGNIVYSAPVVGATFLVLESVIEMIGVICGELKPFEAGKKRMISWHNEPEAGEGDE